MIQQSIRRFCKKELDPIAVAICSLNFCDFIYKLGTEDQKRKYIPKESLISRIREDMGVDSEIEFLSKGDGRFVALYKFLKVVPE
jgi:hypothetical protein